MAKGFGEALRKGFLGAMREQLRDVLPGEEESLCKRIEGLWPSILEAHRGLLVDSAAEAHVGISSVVLAAYRVLGERIPDRQALTGVLRHALHEGMKQQVPMEQFFDSMLRNNPDPFKILVDYSKQGEIHAYGKGFVFERERDDDESYRANVKKCLYYDFFTANGLPELTRIFCDADLLWMDVLKRGNYGVVCERATTMAYGAETCPFQFNRVRKKT
jgi:hypothetical protein